MILRPFAIEDAPSMYENWASDPEVTKFMKWPVHSGVEATKELLAEWVKEYEKEDKYEWCLELKETGEPIGSLGAFAVNEKVKSIEVGYCISRAYWHQGITSEALKAVCAYLLGEVGFQRLEACHDPKNPHSGGVMRKCGFQYEGTKIRGDWNNSGICDICLYGLVKGQMSQQSEAEPSAMKQLYQSEAEPAVRAKTESVELSAAKSLRQAKEEPTAEPLHQAKEEPTAEPLHQAKEELIVPPAARQSSRITDETIEYVGILAKLELSAKEREQAKEDMGRMLDYIDMLNELDTQGVEPMSHIFPVQNVFREDVVQEDDGREALLKNAPAQKESSLKVPRTVE